MVDAWILVGSQIGSVMLWCFAVLALLDIIGELRCGSFGLVCFLSICSGLSAWADWWLWP